MCIHIVIDSYNAGHLFPEHNRTVYKQGCAKPRVAHHHVCGPDTGSNSGERQWKKYNNSAFFLSGWEHKKEMQNLGKREGQRPGMFFSSKYATIWLEVRMGNILGWFKQVPKCCACLTLRHRGHFDEICVKRVYQLFCWIESEWNVITLNGMCLLILNYSA